MNLVAKGNQKKKKRKKNLTETLAHTFVILGIKPEDESCFPYPLMYLIMKLCLNKWFCLQNMSENHL